MNRLGEVYPNFLYAINSCSHSWDTFWVEALSGENERSGSRYLRGDWSHFLNVAKRLPPVAARWFSCQLLGCNTDETSENSNVLSPSVTAQFEKLAMRRSGLVVFDADGTIWDGDVGKAFLKWQLDTSMLRPEQGLMMREKWIQFEKGNLSEEEIWTLAATCQAGLKATKVAEAADRFFGETHEEMIFEPIRDLIRSLRATGIEVWIVSASQKWIVEAGASRFGIDPNHVIAVTPVVEDGIITSEPMQPVPYGEGKSTAIIEMIGRTPDIVVGNSDGDVPMLRLATAVAIVVNPNPALEKLAEQSAWIVQRLEAH